MSITYDQISDAMRSIAREVTEAKADGQVTIREVLEIAYECAPRFMAHVGSLTQLSGAEKKALVMAAYADLWAALDPDIPWLPGWVDDPIEEGIRLALGVLIDNLYDAAAQRFPAILG